MGETTAKRVRGHVSAVMCSACYYPLLRDADEGWLPCAVCERDAEIARLRTALHRAHGLAADVCAGIPIPAKDAREAFRMIEAALEAPHG